MATKRRRPRNPSWAGSATTSKTGGLVPRSWVQVFLATSVGLFAGSQAAALLTDRALYADGAAYFVNVLDSGTFFDLLPSRRFADRFMELPLVVALTLGVSDLSVLRKLFGLGCLAAWPLAIVSCWRIAPRHVWIVLFACGAGYLNAAFHAVGEHSIAHAAIWPVLYVVALARPIRPWMIPVTLLCCTLLIRSYETSVVTNAILAILLIARASRPELPKAFRGLLMGSALLLALGIPIAVKGILRPQSGNAQSFVTGTVRILQDPPWTVAMTLCAVVVVVGLVWGARWGRRPLLLLVPLVLLVAIWGLEPLYRPDQLIVHEQHRARAINVAVPLVALLAVPALTWRRRGFDRMIRVGSIVAATVLSAQSLWHLSATVHWKNYLRDLGVLLESSSGVMPIAETPLAQRRFHRPGALPHLCILTSPGGVIRSLLVVEGRGYFDFRTPSSYPRLERFGIAYEPLFAAIEAQPELPRWKAQRGQGP